MNSYITLKEYVHALNALLEAKPDAGDLPVYYHTDDEGNDMHTVSFMPDVYYMVDDSRTVTGVEMLDYEREGHSLTKCVIIN